MKETIKVIFFSLILFGTLLLADFLLSLGFALLLRFLPVGGQPYTDSLTSILVCAVLIYVLRFPFNKLIKDKGLIREGGINKSRHIVLITCIGIILYFITFSGASTFYKLVLKAFDISSRSASEINFEYVAGMDRTDGLSMLLFIVATCFFAPVIEELFFRGFLLRYTASKINLPFGMLFSSLLFGTAHFDIRQGIMTFISGMIYAFLFYCVKNILVPIICHSLNNFIAAIPLFFPPENGTISSNNTVEWTAIINVLVAAILAFLTIKAIRHLSGKKEAIFSSRTKWDVSDNDSAVLKQS